MSEPFQRALIGTVLQSTESTDLRLREEVSRIPSSTDGVVEMLSRCLPHIVPNVLLAKREVGTLSSVKKLTFNQVKEVVTYPL